MCENNLSAAKNQDPEQLIYNSFPKKKGSIFLYILLRNSPFSTFFPVALTNAALFQCDSISCHFRGVPRFIEDQLRPGVSTSAKELPLLWGTASHEPSQLPGDVSWLRGPEKSSNPAERHQEREEENVIETRPHSRNRRPGASGQRNPIGANESPHARVQRAFGPQGKLKEPG